MLPSVPAFSILKNESTENIDFGVIKGRCETLLESQNNQTNNMKTSINKTNSISPNQPVSQTSEKSHDKQLRPIIPKPINVVCVPDISCMREVEADINERHEVLVKKSDERVKISGVCSTKHEKDNEDETPVLKKTNATGRSPPKAVKKKPKQIRDLEKTLNCLLSDSEQVKDEKAFAFAQSYFLKVTETLHGKDDTTYHDFMKTMNEFGITIFDAAELYKKVAMIFEKYPTLSEEFLAFLLPEQAMQCGKFMEYLMITKMRNFCRKLELYYSKQPSQLRKIYSSFSTLASNNKATVEDLRNTILPLLRNNSLLVNMFLELMPTEAPHASSLTDYESMDFSSIDVQNPKPEDWFETVEVPPPAEDSMYGGEDCICPCHIPPEGKTRRRSAHCMSCGTKFIQGRVYIHSGSMLRPARVSFKEMRTKAIERLSVKNLKTRRKIDKNQPHPSGSKKSSSSKGETLPSNTSANTNKITSVKPARKAPKGKLLNENQKKPNKPLTPPKTPHNKKMNSDKKIPKPPRKSIKILSNCSENACMSSTTLSPVKSHSDSSKKGILQEGKVGCKVDMKTLNKITSEFPVGQTETLRRTGRSTARNLTYANEKTNRKRSVDTVKVENVNLLTTDMYSKKSEENFKSLQKEETYAMQASAMLGRKIDYNLSQKNSHEHISQTKEESLTSESEGKSSYKVMEVNTETMLAKNKDTDYQICESQACKNIFSIEKSALKNSQLLKDTGQCNFKEILSPDIVIKQNSKEKNRTMDLEQCAEESSSEEDAKISNNKNLDVHSKCVLHCPYISSDDKSDDSSSDQFVEVAAQKRAVECNDAANTSQSEEEDLTKEIMEFDNSFENISSEDEKNVLDSEDFPYNSSSESEIDESLPMDVEEDICEENEFGTSSTQYNTERTSTENIVPETNFVRPPGTGWTRDEDKIILRTFQSVTSSELVFQKICHELPTRTAEEVRSRFQTLMSYLQKMASD